MASSRTKCREGNTLSAGTGLPAHVSSSNPYPTFFSISVNIYIHTHIHQRGVSLHLVSLFTLSCCTPFYSVHTRLTIAIMSAYRHHELFHNEQHKCCWPCTGPQTCTRCDLPCVVFRCCQQTEMQSWGGMTILARLQG